jgi:uncharacterized protein (TIGR02444 family)
MTSRLDLDGAHWQFALSLYGQDAAANACIRLQDRLGVDVNVLLVAMFAAIERGIVITLQDVRDMDTLVQPWRTETVAPLRAMRRRLKQPLGPTREYAEVLRLNVKSAELLAEQIEQALLAHWLDRRTGGRRSESPDLPAILRAVVAYFAEGVQRSAETEAPEVKDALRSLILASARMGPGAVKSSL